MRQTLVWIYISIFFNIFLSIIESQPGTPSKTAKKEAELGASEFKLQKNAEVYSEPISAETLSNGTAKEAAPAQRNISCLSDANTAAGSAQREVVVSDLTIFSYKSGILAIFGTFWSLLSTVVAAIVRSLVARN